MVDNDRHLWDLILTHLRQHQARICRQWFDDLKPLGIAAGSLQLGTSSNVHRDYLRRSCAQQFSEAAQTVSGRLLTIRFLGPQDDVMLPEPPKRKPQSVVRATPSAINGQRAATPQLQRTNVESAIGPIDIPAIPAAELESKPDSHREIVRDRGLIINPDYAFENFVQGPGNRLAHAASLAVGAQPGRTYNPLFIHGGVGLGKTHLLQAICLRIHEAKPSANIYYTSCDGFITQFMDAVQAGQMSDFRHRFRDLDVLVIDDIHFLAKRERTQEEFFHTFNSLYQLHKQIVLSSDAAPEEIPDLEERLVSRFKSGLVAKMETPDYETRAAIVKTKGKLRGLEISNEVAEYIASRVDTNIRELEGAIVNIQMRALVERVPIDLDLARNSLGEAVQEVTAEPSMQAIITIVSDYYRVRPAEVLSKRRERSVTMPRQVCMYLSRKHTRHSLEEIGLSIGGRDHTTVMHAVRIVEAKMAQEPDFSKVVGSLVEKIKPTKLP